MLIRVSYTIGMTFAAPTPLAWMLSIHPDEDHRVVEPDAIAVEPSVPVTTYRDVYGNRCGRAVAPAGLFTIRNKALVRDTGLPDAFVPDALAVPVGELPDECLLYLLPSRYCEVDSELRDVAWREFGHFTPGWTQVQAVVNYVHRHIRFDYMQARGTRTAWDGWREQVGVCRDFTHLAVALCRCLNLPARYCTGYLGDIGVPVSASPMDFSAWFEVYLAGRWYTFDARHNRSRIGRIVMARGRDAADVALTTTFGPHTLTTFEVGTDVVG